MKQLFLWFYRLDYLSVLLALGFSTGIYLRLRHRYGRKALWKILTAVLLAGCLAAVAGQTVLRRTGGDFIPFVPAFASYRELLHGGNKEILRSNVMNIALFYPLGLLLADFLPKKLPKVPTILLVTVLLGLLTLKIEQIQSLYGLGVPEWDDVIHNTLGAFLGAWASFIPIPEEK